MKIRITALLSLMLCMGIFQMPAYASDSGETLKVTAAWVDGELLRINVTDAEGTGSALALRLSDYVNDAENNEYISVQAIDLAGNKSGVIEIKNPYYIPPAEPKPITTQSANEPNQSSQSAVSAGNNAFTPDGAGTVLDNVTESNGKEFFTVGTEDGSVFYLIVDRQRNSDNVYLLNAVTEQDLIALAEKNGKEITTNSGTSAIEIPEQTTLLPSVSEPPEPVSEAPKIPESPAKNDTVMYIIIGVIVIAVGGAGYYFKIVKGRKNTDYNDNEDEDDNNYGYENEPDDDEDITEDGGDSE